MSLYKKIRKKILGGILNEFNRNGCNGLSSLDLIKPFPFQQELQHLYDSIELILGQQNDCKTIVIASSTHGEGSSTIASYYALFLATGIKLSTNSGKASSTDDSNILLVDGNFRHPSIHLLFNLENEQGFAELLQEQAELNQVVNQLEELNLTIITAGSAIENPVEIFRPEPLTRIIEQFKNNFSYIIIDAAPILPYLDSLTVIKQCDGLVLNLRAESTRREVVRKAKLKLMDSNVNILGVVLNGRGYHIPEVIYNHI